MNLVIKTRDLDLTPALKEWIDEKVGGLERFVAKYEEGGDVLCEIEVARTTKHHHKGDVFSAEISLHMPGRKLRAEDQDFDARVAVDRARDKMQRELVKYKEKSGLTGKALRQIGNAGKKAMRRLVWWRNKS